jgi:hypothetical protein
MRIMMVIEPDDTREIDQLIDEIEKVLDKRQMHIAMMALSALVGKGIARVAKESNMPYGAVCDEWATALKKAIADNAEPKRRVQ